MRAVTAPTTRNVSKASATPITIPTDPVIEKLYSQDLRTSINEAIAALPAKCREVFSLSYLQGFSHREISEQMGIAQSTVENHIYLALRQLRAKLSKSELILLLFFIFLQNNSHPLG